MVFLRLHSSTLSVEDQLLLARERYRKAEAFLQDCAAQVVLLQSQIAKKNNEAVAQGDMVRHDGQGG